MVVCAVCSKSLKMITNSHLRVHALTTEQYLTQYQGSTLNDPEMIAKYTATRMHATRPICARPGCGKPVTESHNKFCSTSCRAKEVSVFKTLIGEKHPHYRHGEYCYSGKSVEPKTGQYRTTFRADRLVPATGALPVTVVSSTGRRVVYRCPYCGTEKETARSWAVVRKTCGNTQCRIAHAAATKVNERNCIDLSTIDVENLRAICADKTLTLVQKAVKFGHSTRFLYMCAGHFGLRLAQNYAVGERSNSYRHGGYVGRRKGRGTKPNYGPDWPDAAKAAKERDNYTCQDCGETTKRTLAVHHEPPYFVSKSHDLTGLVTLCGRCHGKRDAAWTAANPHITVPPEYQ